MTGPKIIIGYHQFGIYKWIWGETGDGTYFAEKSDHDFKTCGGTQYFPAESDAGRYAHLRSRGFPHNGALMVLSGEKGSHFG